MPLFAITQLPDHPITKCVAPAGAQAVRLQGALWMTISENIRYLRVNQRSSAAKMDR